jgi:hypothetical protein
MVVTTIVETKDGKQREALCLPLALLCLASENFSDALCLLIPFCCALTSCSKCAICTFSEGEAVPGEQVARVAFAACVFVGTHPKIGESFFVCP